MPSKIDNFSVKGGGKIEHVTEISSNLSFDIKTNLEIEGSDEIEETQVIHIGYKSDAFGKADHSIAQEIIQDIYEEYDVRIDLK